MTFCPDRFFAEANSAYCHDSRNISYGYFLLTYLSEHYIEIYVQSPVTLRKDLLYDDKKRSVGEFVKFIYSQETP
jgi:hypothetical protein